MKSYFKEGDKVTYTYTHWTNSKTCFERHKNGTFVRTVKSRRYSPYDWQPNPKVVIKLDGNKGNSIVWLSEIKHFNQK